ncbi:MAG: hypothetical protein ACF8OB_19945 [Phycisphaeraceae bacterium JB051]
MKLYCFFALMVCWSFMLVGCETTPMASNPYRPAIKMRSTGNEPRQVLRYHYSKGQFEKLICKNHVDVENDLRGFPLIVLSPFTRETFLVKVMEVQPDGNMLIGFFIDKVDFIDHANPEASKGADLLFEQFNGINGTYVMTPTGQIKEVTLVDSHGIDDDLAKALRDDIRQMLKMMTCKFPSEPVGEGAQWSYQLPSDEDDEFPSIQNITVKIKEIYGDHVKMDVYTYQSLVGKQFHREGFKFELTQFIRHGRGEWKLNRSHLTPHLKINERFLQRLQIRKGDQGTSMTTEGKVSTSIEPYGDI